MSSSVIAVCVSLIGLLGMVFTVAIFVQMLLSFPAMLSSNSRAYVQQQRKLYNISPSHEVPPPEEAEEEYSGLVAAEDSWVDLLDEDLTTTTTTTAAKSSRTHAGTRRPEPGVTRGRTLRRGARRRHSARTVVRMQDGRGANAYMQDTAVSARGVDGRQDCLPGWRTMEWSR